MSARRMGPVLSIIILSLLSACGRNGDLYFSIEVRKTGGLAQGDLVFSDGKAIGRVTGVNHADPSRALIEVKVFEEFRDRVTASSSFVIRQPNPGLPSRPRIEVKTPDPASDPLPQGFEVKGKSRIKAPLND